MKKYKRNPGSVQSAILRRPYQRIFPLFMLPMFGALSDKHKGKSGRRTPFIRFGTIVAAIALEILALGDSHSDMYILGNCNSSVGQLVYIIEYCLFRNRILIPDQILLSHV